MKLNLGCGPNPKTKGDGWINVDVQPFDGVDLVHDLYKPLPYVPETADIIVAQHVLEHIGYQHINRILAEWIKILRLGGELQIGVPDLDRLAQGYVDGSCSWDDFVQQLYNVVADRTIIGIPHLCAYGYKKLEHTLLTLGCSRVWKLDAWEGSWSLQIRAVK